jgi:hypothetical protein
VFFSNAFEWSAIRLAIEEFTRLSVPFSPVARLWVLYLASVLYLALSMVFPRVLGHGAVSPIVMVGIN